MFDIAYHSTERMERNENEILTAFKILFGKNANELYRAGRASCAKTGEDIKGKRLLVNANAKFHHAISFSILKSMQN